MNGQAAIHSETEALKGIVRLLLSLAALAERGSTQPLRSLVLWMLRAAEAIMLEFVGNDLPACVPAVRTGNSSADAMRLARSFRALAVVVGAMSCRASRFMRRQAFAGTQSPVPPPLTPPHKGEGNFGSLSATPKVFLFQAASRPRDPPPPCGEGSGVGVSPYR